MSKSVKPAMTAVLDSGATGMFVPMSMKGGKERMVQDGIIAQSFDNDLTQAKATDLIPSPDLPCGARHCNKFDDHTMSDPLISAPVLAEHGCAIMMNLQHAVVFNHKMEPVLVAPHDPTRRACLATIPSTPRDIPHNTMNHRAASACELQAVPDLVNFLHAAAGCPPKSTWLAAIARGCCMGWPGPTTQRVRRHLRKSEHAVNGHLKLIRHGARSTSLRRSNKHELGLFIEPTSDMSSNVDDTAIIKNLIASDLTGRCPTVSGRGHKCILVLCDYDSGLILGAPIKSREASEIIRGFNQCYDELRRNNFAAKELRCDNEISAKFVTHLRDDAKTACQLAPPQAHRTNPAERAIQTHKNHFIAMLSGADDDCPADAWDLLIPLANVTLNLMRSSRIQPKLSAHAQIHGKFDYNRHPLGPAGCKVTVLDNERRTFANHGTPGFCIGPSLDHCRTHRCFDPHTGGIRTGNTAEFCPRTNMPKTTAVDRLAMTLCDPQDILTKPNHPATPFLNPGRPIHDALTRLMNLFSLPAVAPRVQSDTKASKTRATPSPRVNKAPESTRNAKCTNNTTMQPIGTIARRRFKDGKHYEGQATDYDTINGHYKILHQDGDSEEYDEQDMKRCRKPSQTHNRRPQRACAMRSNAPQQWLSDTINEQLRRHRACAAGGTIWDPTINRMAHHGDLTKHSNPETQQRWDDSGVNEFGRLPQGCAPHEVQGMDVLDFIHCNEVPKDKKATHARCTVACRPEKDDPCRTRIAAGGDELECCGNVSTQVSTMETFKMPVNSAISTPKAKMVAGDMANMCSESFLIDAECVRFPVHLIPKRIIDCCKLHDGTHNGCVHAKVKKAWHGLKQSGKIAHDDLVAHLAAAGCHKTLTEGPFKHESGDTTFCLVVDDFGIKHTKQEDAEHLINHIRKKCTFEVDWEAKRHTGIDIVWDCVKRTAILSVDGCVHQALQELQHAVPKRHQFAPSAMERPQCGQKIQHATEDTSEELGQQELKFIQRAVGKFLFCAGAIDNTMLHALNDIASAKGTKQAMSAVKHFLDCAACNQDAKITYRASDMVVQADSDAACLVCPEARSRAGGHAFLGSADEKLFNGPMTVSARVIERVMSSAAEAEVSALFMNAQEIIPMRKCLEEPGHPQPAAPIETDNGTATGTVNNAIKQKRSKSFDMNHHWLRDRVKSKEFDIHWEPGAQNLGDHPTEHHTGRHHRIARPICLHDEAASPHTVQGCVKMLSGIKETQMKAHRVGGILKRKGSKRSNTSHHVAWDMVGALPKKGAKVPHAPKRLHVLLAK